MDVGEFRLEALTKGEGDEQNREELNALRDEFLAGADPNSPSWSATFRGKEITPDALLNDALLNLDFGSGLKSPSARKERVVDKLRRIFWNIFK